MFHKITIVSLALLLPVALVTFTSLGETSNARGDVRIELAASSYANPSLVWPKLAGRPEIEFYLPAQRGYFSHFFLQVNRYGNWEPAYEFVCEELFDGKTIRYTVGKSDVIGVSWREVRSTFTPKGFKVAPGLYRFSLVYTRTDPSTVSLQEVGCELIHSPEFTLTGEAHFTK